jgi:GTP cyclohydrolase II
VDTNQRNLNLTSKPSHLHSNQKNREFQASKSRLKALGISNILELTQINPTTPDQAPNTKKAARAIGQPLVCSFARSFIL